MSAILLILALVSIVLYVKRDKTMWVYSDDGTRRHDKADPKRTQVWDDSEMDDWHSGDWVDA